LKYLFKILADICIVLCIFSNFILIIVLSHGSTEDLINSDEYVDLIEKSSIYKAMNIIDSCNILLLILKILHVLTIIKAVRIIVKTVKLAFQQILIYAFIIMPMLVAYALIGMGVYGPYVGQFSTFEGSFLAVLGFIVGQCDLNTMMRYDPLWTILYVISLTIIIIYLIISSFSAILIDSFEYIVYKEGYPGEAEEDTWTAKDAFIWMLDILPSKWLAALNLNKNKNINDNEEGNDI